MVEGGAYDRQISLVKGQNPILNATLRRSGTKVQDLEISVTIHPDILRSTRDHKLDVHRTRGIERPDMNALCVDLWFNEAEMVLARRRWDAQVSRGSKFVVRHTARIRSGRPPGLNVQL